MDNMVSNVYVEIIILLKKHIPWKYKSITYFSFAVTTYKFLKLQYYLRAVLDS